MLAHHCKSHVKALISLFPEVPFQEYKFKFNYRHSGTIYSIILGREEERNEKGEERREERREKGDRERGRRRAKKNFFFF